MESSLENANGQQDPESTPESKKLVDLIRDKKNVLSSAYHAIVLPPIILNNISKLEASIKDGAFETLLQLLHDQIKIESATIPEPTDSHRFALPNSVKRGDYAGKKLTAIDELRKCASSYSRKKEEDREQLLEDIKLGFVELLHNHLEQAEHISVGIEPEECDQKANQLIEDGVQVLEAWCNRQDIAEVDELVRILNSKDDSQNIATPKTSLQNAKTHQSLTIMLKSIDRFEPFLKVIFEQTGAFNERIQCDLDTPLHYAVRSQNASFIEWLLEKDSLDVNCRNKQMKTALFLACEQYNDVRRKVRDLKERAAQLKKCRKYILLLLQRRADFNICSSKALLPYELLTQNGKPIAPLKKQMQLKEQDFLFQCENTVQEKGVGNILKRCGNKFTNLASVRITIELMEIFLRFKDLGTFENEFSKFAVKKDDASKVIALLLHTAVEMDLQKSVDLIVKDYEKVIFTVVPKSSHLKYRVELKGLLKKACESANVATLAVLLRKMEKDTLLINEENILVYTLNLCAKLANDSDQKSNLLQCALLMATDKKICHTKTDKYGNTALHIALKYGFTDVAKALTVNHKYMFLGIENKKGETPLDLASYEFCQAYFDQCVSQIDSGEILIDLNGINPYILRKDKTNPIPKVRFQKGTHRRDFRSEMACLKAMANSKKHKQLLHHPLIFTFILIKWLRFSTWHCINLLLTMLATVAFAWFSIEHICNANFSMPLYLASCCGFAFVVVRELLQWIMFDNKYFRMFQNWIDLAHILGMLVVLCFKDFSLIFSLVAIIYAIQIIQLIGSLPFNSISTYRCMFRVVALNFIKSIALFCPLMLAFAYSFFLYYNDKLVPVNKNGTDNPFESATAAGVKIMVMASGEFEAASMNISGNVVIIFLLFIFCVPMVIQNLINGLAVSDISEIRKESESINLSEKVLLLARFESGLNRNTRYRVINYILKYVRRLSPRLFFRNYHHVIKIAVKENAKIMIDSRYTRSNCCKNPGLNCFKSSGISQPTETMNGVKMVPIAVQSQTEPELGPLLPINGVKQSTPAPKRNEKSKPSKHFWEFVPRISSLGMFSPLAKLDDTKLEELLSIAKRKEILKAQKSKKAHT